MGEQDGGEKLVVLLQTSPPTPTATTPTFLIPDGFAAGKKVEEWPLDALLCSFTRKVSLTCTRNTPSARRFLLVSGFYSQSYPT